VLIRRRKNEKKNNNNNNSKNLIWSFAKMLEVRIVIGVIKIIQMRWPENDFDHSTI